VEPGTFERIVYEDGVEAFATATRIGEVTLTPVHEPNCVHDSNTFPCVASNAIAGLS
jgi:hypothetical protein